MAAEDHVIIVGAGIAGLAAAIMLARDHGVRVTLYESQTDLTIGKTPQESYAIGVNPRGLGVLDLINPQLRPQIEIAGFVDAWSINGGGREVARQQSGTVVGTTRGTVIAALYKEAMDTIAKGHKIEFKLGLRLKQVETKKRSLVFLNEAGTEVRVDTSKTRVLDGTGCWSKIRDALAEEDSTFVVERWGWGQHFRNLFTTKADTGFDPKVHYIFSAVAGMYVASLGEDRWAFSIGCLESQEESMAWFLDKEPSADKIAKLKAHVAEMCPKVLEVVEEEEWTRFFSYRSFTGQVVKCSRLNNGEELAFFGDSCHAVLPATGEGTNSALEDVKVLVEAYVESRKSGEPWFETYNTMRLPDANALSDYAHYLVEQAWIPKAEKNRRTANMITVSVLRKIGIYSPTWNELTFGEAAKLCTPYRECFEIWQRQSGKAMWLSNFFAYFANRNLPAEETEKTSPEKSHLTEVAQGA